MISLKGLTFRYDGDAVVDDVSLNWQAGEHIGLMGANGSGKSTLAMLIKGLLAPAGGTISIDGQPSAEVSPGKVGLVFQNPENQIAAVTVEREVAFGLENLGIPRAEMKLRVEEALKRQGLIQYRKHSPHLLSGGQMQKLALASVLAMQPDYLIFDEPTSMLDPVARVDFLKSLDALPRNTGVLFITQFSSEVLGFSRMIVMKEGKTFFDGDPHDFFSRRDLTEAADVEPPVKYRLNV